MTSLAIDIAQVTWLWSTTVGLILAFVIAVLSLYGSDLAPLAVILSVPIQRVVLIGFGEHHITFTQAWFAAFVAGAILRFALGQLKIRVDVAAALFIAMPLLMAFSIVANPPISAWAGETWRWITPALFFVLARDYFTKRSGILMAAILAVVLLACSAWAAWQVGSQSGPTSFTRNGLLRVYGGFGEPNPFAAFLVFASLVVAGSIALKVNWQLRSLLVLGSLAGFATVGLTQSRGGLLGLACGLGLFIVLVLKLAPRPIRTVVMTGAAVAASFAIVLLVRLAPWQVHSQEVTTANWAEREREAHWVAAWNMIVAHPVFGVGAGGFNAQFRQYTTDWRFRISRGHAHNAYLQVAAEAGICALLVYLALLATVSRRLFDRIRDDESAPFAAGVLTGTTALIVHGLFDYLNVLSLGLLFAGSWACALAPLHKDDDLRDRNRSY